MKKVFLCLIAIMFLSSCGQSDVKTEEYQGREETKKVEALDALGYDGTGVRKAVDNLIDTNEQRNKDLEAAQE